jgi:hypothetical protein
MWGEMTGTNAFLRVKPDGAFEGNSTPVISMIRSLAKIEVGVDIYGSGSALGYGTTFLMDSVFVCNISDTGYIAPEAAFINGSYKTNPSTGVSRPNTRPTRITPAQVVRYAFPSQTSNPDLVLRNTIYVPESDSLTSTQDPAFLVISAKYYAPAPGGTPDSIYYYRVDFAKRQQNDPNMAILRNHSYEIDILNIRLEGYKSLADAMAAPVSGKNYAVVIGGSSSSVSDEINDIVAYKDIHSQNYQYMLGVNTGEILFDWDGTCIGASSPGDYFKLKLFTDYEGGWEASVPGPGSLPITLNSGAGGDVIQLSKPTPTTSSVKYDSVLIGITGANQMNLFGVERRYEVTLTAGMLKKKILVRQLGGANSVVVRPGGMVTIPIAYGGKGKDTLALGINWPILPANLAVDVLWDENSLISATPTLVPPSFDRIQVDCPTGNEGNALVALKDNSNNEILWSWHIWVTNDPVNADFHHPNTPVLMKTVIGETGSSRPYYQWGRKDPFIVTASPSYTTQAATNLAGNGMLVRATQNPTVFYTGAVPPYFNWAGNYVNSSLWDNAGGGKSYLDPCPAGWRVPGNTTPSPWTNAPQSDLTGMPAGYLLYNNGNAAATGKYFWTSTASGTNVYRTDAGTYPPVNGTMQRANGLMVRCVKDISRKY